MSIDINWPSDPQDLNEKIAFWLNDHCQKLELPNFLRNLHVKNFSIGSVGPTLTIRHIGDPFDEFYHQEDEEELEKSTNDIQFLVEVDYKGDVTLEIEIELLINYPSPEFIKLPVNLKIVEMSIHSLLVISYISKRVFLSFLCDISDNELDDILKNPRLSKDKTTRIDIIRNLKIENEIGELKNVSAEYDQGAILRNVDKVERFLTDLIRDLLRDELAWPGWIEFDFNDDEEDELSDNDPLNNTTAN